MGTTYQWQVQGVDCDGNGTATDWSETATFTTPFGKDITGYGNDVNVKTGWYLIASPVAEAVTPTEANGFLTNNYDLYYFDQNGDSEGKEWINIKQESEGSYTIDNNFKLVNGENVSFGYLHLVDNMTGNDVDLLANPSYTFEAKKTDYRSRFKLVFATGSSTSSDTFAFCSNGNWVINNDGNATLQVIDVNGRIIRSESINGCANVNLIAAPGVYMIRLINGSNVKTQKVVVR